MAFITIQLPSGRKFLRHFFQASNKQIQEKHDEFCSEVGCFPMKTDFRTQTSHLKFGAEVPFLDPPGVIS